MAKQDRIRMKTVRVPINHTPAVGIALEISNPSNSGVNLCLRKAVFRATTAAVVSLYRRSAAASGGTSANMTPCCSSSSDTSAVTTGNAKQFTVAPTPGSNVDLPMLFTIPSAVLQADQISDDDVQPLMIAPGQTLSIETTVSSLWTGYLQWTEEPV